MYNCSFPKRLARSKGSTCPRGTILRRLVHLEPPDSRLHRLALHLAVPGVSAGAHGLPDDHQVAASLAKRLETALARAAQRRDLGDFCRAGRAAGLRREAAERLADDAAALARPYLGGAMMPVVPPVVDGRVGGGEREARPALALTVKNKVQGVVRVDAAAIARAVGRDLGDGVAAAVAALLLRLAEDEDGRAFEHLAARRHRVSGGGAPLLYAAVTARRRARRRLDDDDLRQHSAGELARQRVHVPLESVPAIRAQAESDGLRRRLRARV